MRTARSCLFASPTALPPRPAPAADAVRGAHADIIIADDLGPAPAPFYIPFEAHFEQYQLGRQQADAATMQQLMGQQGGIGNLGSMQTYQLHDHQTSVLDRIFGTEGRSIMASIAEIFGVGKL